MSSSIQRTLLIVFAVLFSDICNAADITLDKAPWGEPAIKISGEILKGDMAKIARISKELLNKNQKVQFLLNSFGGDFFEALKIGEFVQKLNARTMVVGVSTRKPQAEITKCYSACFVILVSGSIRDYNGDNVFWDKSGNKQLKVIPVVGIHRPYVNPAEYSKLQAQDARELYNRLERLTRQYLEKIGISQSIVDEMFSVSSQEAKLIGKEEYSKRIGYYQPYFEEWLISRCGTLDEQERTDLADIMVTRIVKKNKSAIPKSMSTGYAEYLEKKQEKIEQCESTTVLKHQKEVIDSLFKQKS